ncbi:MAG: hypothetical protein HC905_28645 [Bacteroidales bacterium]|nr:hypothetical protein [Bacteroidales bacterium]
MLTILEPLKIELVSIICFLSYGDKLYIDEVIEKGKNFFGEKFIPITEFLTKEKFAEVVSDVDFLIMNNIRQQGLGNVFTYLYLGKKVFIRPENGMYNFFKRKGFRIYNTLDLFENLSPLKEINENELYENKKIASELLNINTYIKEWKPILK